MLMAARELMGTEGYRRSTFGLLSAEQFVELKKVFWLTFFYYETKVAHLLQGLARWWFNVRSDSCMLLHLTSQSLQNLRMCRKQSTLPC